jgi:hypothetical protein
MSPFVEALKRESDKCTNTHAVAAIVETALHRGVPLEMATSLAEEIVGKNLCTFDTVDACKAKAKELGFHMERAHGLATAVSRTWKVYAAYLAA